MAGYNRENPGVLKVLRSSLTVEHFSSWCDNLDLVYIYIYMCTSKLHCSRTNLYINNPSSPLTFSRTVLVITQFIVLRSTSCSKYQTNRFFSSSVFFLTLHFLLIDRTNKDQGKIVYCLKAFSFCVI